MEKGTPAGRKLAAKRQKLTIPVDTFDVMNLNFRIWEFRSAVTFMQESPNDDNPNTKSTYDFIWGLNVGLPAKWRITFLHKSKNMNCPIFGVALKLVETVVPANQPLMIVFDVEIRKPDGSTFLYASGNPVDMNQKGRISGFPRLVPVATLQDPYNGVLVENEHLNLHMSFKIFGPSYTESSPIEEITMSTGLSKDMLRLFDSGEDSDMEIVHPDGTSFRVHKFMLMARSPFFKEKFKESVATPGKFELEDNLNILSRTMQIVFKFMYGGVLDANWKKYAENMVSTAVLLRMEELVSVLERKLVEICTRNNYKDMCRIAEAYNMKNAQNEIKIKAMVWEGQGDKNLNLS